MPELSSPLPETNEPRSDSKSFLDFMKSMGVSGLSERERQIEVACMEPSQVLNLGDAASALQSFYPKVA